MKRQVYALFFIMISILFACNQTKQKEKPDDNFVSDNPNEALYYEVMDIHDEVMAKMQTLYQLKMKLQKQLEDSMNLADDEVRKIHQRMVQADSADKLMRDWMHEFNPLPDSSDQEEAREYLESELEKIKKVKEAILEVLEKEQ